MKNFKNSVTAIIILMSVLFANQSLVFANNSNIYSTNIKLFINGNEMKDLPMPPVIYNDYTLVPAREVFEPLGAVVDWKSETKEIYVGKDNELLILQINNKIANFNSDELEMNIPPQIINNKTMIPLRFVAETFGLEVEWKGDKREAHVNEIIIEEPEPTPSPIPSPTATPRPTASASPSTTPSASPSTTPNNTNIRKAEDISPTQITEQTHPETTINNITFPSGSSSSFVIQASSAISKVEKTLLPDNRLVLDFYNANLGLSKTIYNINNGSVGQVRVSQFQTEPEKIVRVVFELNQGIRFSTGISSDRNRINLDFESNTVLSVNFSSNGNEDYIDLTFQNEPTINTMYLLSPERVVVDVMLAKLNNPIEKEINGRFANLMRTAQFNETTARIVLELKQTAKHNVSINGKTARITLTEPTYRNIQYNPDNATVIINKNGTNLQAAKIGHTDMYLDGKYILNLGGDFSSLLGYGDYLINNEGINSVTIETKNGQTQLIIKESSIFAFVVTEDSNKLYVKKVKPKEIYDRVVVLDPGHGGTDPGASGNGETEKTIVADIANKAKALLEADGRTKVYLTRSSDVYVDHMDRVNTGEQAGDMFISIHTNAAKNNPVPNGTETYYYPHSNDSTIGISTQKMADIIHKHLILNLGTNDRKVKTESFIVIKYNTIPSILIETAFISNPDDAALLGSDEFRQKIAKAICDGVNEIFRDYTIKRK